MKRSFLLIAVVVVLSALMFMGCTQVVPPDPDPVYGDPTIALLLPVNAAPNMAQALVNFTWAAQAGAAVSGVRAAPVITGYTFYWKKSAESVYQEKAVTVMNTTLATLDYATTYNWKVKVTQSDSKSKESDVRTFTTEVAPIPVEEVEGVLSLMTRIQLEGEREFFYQVTATIGGVVYEFEDDALAHWMYSKTMTGLQPLKDLLIKVELNPVSGKISHLLEVNLPGGVFIGFEDLIIKAPGYAAEARGPIYIMPPAGVSLLGTLLPLQTAVGGSSLSIQNVAGWQFQNIKFQPTVTIENYTHSADSRGVLTNLTFKNNIFEKNATVTDNGVTFEDNEFNGTVYVNGDDASFLRDLFYFDVWTSGVGDPYIFEGAGLVLNGVEFNAEDLYTGSKTGLRAAGKGVYFSAYGDVLSGGGSLYTLPVTVDNFAAEFSDGLASGSRGYSNIFQHLVRVDTYKALFENAQFLHAAPFVSSLGTLVTFNLSVFSNTITGLTFPNTMLRLRANDCTFAKDLILSAVATPATEFQQITRGTITGNATPANARFVGPLQFNGAVNFASTPGAWFTDGCTFVGPLTGNSVIGVEDLIFDGVTFLNDVLVHNTNGVTFQKAVFESAWGDHNDIFFDTGDVTLFDVLFQGLGGFLIEATPTVTFRGSAVGQSAPVSDSRAVDFTTLNSNTGDENGFLFWDDAELTNLGLDFGSYEADFHTRDGLEVKGLKLTGVALAAHHFEIDGQDNIIDETTFSGTLTISGKGNTLTGLEVYGGNLTITGQDNSVGFHNIGTAAVVQNVIITGAGYTTLNPMNLLLEGNSTGIIYGTLGVTGVAKANTGIVVRDVDMKGALTFTTADYVQFYNSIFRLAVTIGDNAANGIFDTCLFKGDATVSGSDVNIGFNGNTFKNLTVTGNKHVFNNSSFTPTIVNDDVSINLAGSKVIFNNATVTTHTGGTATMKFNPIDGVIHFTGTIVYKNAANFSVPSSSEHTRCEAPKETPFLIGTTVTWPANVVPIS